MAKLNSTGRKFWNQEYNTKRKNEHLALSAKPSSDLQKFIIWLEKEQGMILNRNYTVLDLGCGNGRNLIYLAKEYGVQGIGYDISSEGITNAEKNSKGIPLTYTARSIAGDIDLPDNSVDLVLDMMASHFLNTAERTHLLSEVIRVLRPGGWIFYKTFLLDGDLHAKALLKKYPAQEPNTYIHPKIGAPEHVSTEREIKDLFTFPFKIHRIIKSHKHLDKQGRANKRRSIAVYVSKEP